jgi:hypothetical protein
MTDCLICHNPIIRRAHRSPKYQQKYCGIACRDEALKIYSIQPCKVCKRLFKKRRKGTVCCSVECFNANKKKPLDKDALIAAMLECRFGPLPNWTNISKKLKCSHHTAVDTAKEFSLIDSKRQGPIVDGQYLPIPEKPPLSIDPNLTSKETLEKDLVANRTINGCWLWTCRTNRQGYGLIYLNRPYDREFLVKAVALYVWKDLPLDQNKLIFNKCGFKNCFNPKHLRVCKSRREMSNCLAKAGKLRVPLGKQHPRWKIDLPMALDIRDGINMGETNKQIVKRLKVSSLIVNNIRKKRTWKYIWKLKSEYIA